MKIPIEKFNRRVSWEDDDNDEDEPTTVLDIFYLTTHEFRHYLECMMGIYQDDSGAYMVVEYPEESMEKLDCLLQLLDQESPTMGPGGDRHLDWIANVFDIGGDESWDIHCGQFDEFVKALTDEIEAMADARDQLALSRAF